MDIDLEKRLKAQEEKLDNVLSTVKKIRRYFLVIFWVTILAVVLPLLGLVFILPKFLQTYLGAFDGLL